MLKKIVIILLIISSYYIFSCGDEGVYNYNFDYDKFDSAYKNRSYDEILKYLQKVEGELVWSYDAMNNPFNISIKNEDMEMLNFLLENNLIVHTEIGDIHKSILDRPLNERKMNIVDKVLEYIPYSDSTNSFYLGLLYKTVVDDKLLKYSKKFVEYGINISKSVDITPHNYSYIGISPDSYSTLLVHAIKNNQKLTVSYLLDKGADPNVITYQTQPYFDFVAVKRLLAIDYTSDKSIIQLLKSKGANSIVDVLNSSKVSVFQEWKNVTCTIPIEDKIIYDSLKTLNPIGKIEKNKSIYILNFSSITPIRGGQNYVYIITEDNRRGYITMDSLWSIDMNRRQHVQ